MTGKADRDSLVTLTSLAVEWDMPESTLRSWRVRNYGPPSFRRGGTVVYRRSVVEAWLAEQEAETASNRRAS